MSPGKAAGLIERLWDFGDFVNLIEEWELRRDEPSNVRE
jgi:hypothetical protein